MACAWPEEMQLMKAVLRALSTSTGVWLSLLLLVGTGSLVVTVAEAEEKCGVCHPTERVAHEVSIHAHEEITCTSCHGGVADSLDADGAHSGGFRALNQRAEIPAACAECHSDLQQMRPYNLPIDQYALYQTSGHGLALARGEERTAVCTDCHQVHDIRPPRDPESSVYPRNLPATCGRCHGDRELMTEVGLDPQVVTDYRSSIHGQALFEGGNLQAPNCTSCHGVHGAHPLGVGDVDKVCGNCHRKTRDAYIEGPHHEAMRDAGLAECAACHASHATRKRDSADIGELCLECHEEGSAQLAVAEKIRALLVGSEEEILKAEQLVARAKTVPLHVEDHQARLAEARTYLTDALLTSHQVDAERVEELTLRARSIGQEVQHDLYPQFDHRVSYVGLAIFWFYLLVTLAILINIKRRLRRAESGS
jgi:predicted CXXCH cytochrome family protein